MRTVLLALVLVVKFPTAQSLSSAQQPDFLALARNTIGGDALAQVQSLHVILSGRNVTSEVGDDPRGESVTTMHVWLHPPSRLLETISIAGSLVRHGVDGSRLLGTHPAGVDAFQPERTLLRKCALTLLLYDPQSLGVALLDEGTTTVSRRCVSHTLLHPPYLWTQEVRAPDEQSPEMPCDSDQGRGPKQRDPVGPNGQG
jgi:hypothetical protein